MPQTYVQALEAQIKEAEDQMFNLYQQTEHLEARVEGLKEALKLYLETEGTPIEEPPLPMPKRSQPARRTKRHGARFDEVLRFIRATGESGATIEDMHHFAVSHGLRLKRTSIRSNVWNHKRAGVLVSMGDGRYRIAQPTLLDGQPVSLKGETGAVAAPAPAITH